MIWGLKLNRFQKNKFKFYDLIIYAARSSSAANRLAADLSCRRWRDDLPSRYFRQRPYFRGNNSPVVVNWGSTRHPDWLEDVRFRLKPVWLNSPKVVGRAIDKSEFFRSLQSSGLPVLKHTHSRSEAEGWLRKGFRVVARKTTTGSGGAGIVVVEPGVNSLLQAPLYTRYYPKTHEFRAHIWQGQLIDFTQKKLRSDASGEINRIVRSHDNAWLFAHEHLAVGEPDIAKMAKGSADCIATLGLDFGAVDVLAIVKNGRMDSYRICEVNTGPGLENTETINAYTQAILHTKEG